MKPMLDSKARPLKIGTHYTCPHVSFFILVFTAREHG